MILYFTITPHDLKGKVEKSHGFAKVLKGAIMVSFWINIEMLLSFKVSGGEGHDLLEQRNLDIQCKVTPFIGISILLSKV